MPQSTTEQQRQMLAQAGFVRIDGKPLPQRPPAGLSMDVHDLSQPSRVLVCRPRWRGYWTSLYDQLVSCTQGGEIWVAPLAPKENKLLIRLQTKVLMALCPGRFSSDIKIPRALFPSE